MSSIHAAGLARAFGRGRKHVAALNQQRRLEISVSQDTPLVNIETARIFRGGVDAETIHQLVEEGQLQWVFDISARGDGEVRELRFWARELQSPEAAAKLELFQVVDAILGQREIWSGTEIEQLLITSRPTVHRLKDELGGVVVGGKIKVRRGALVAFLQRRLA